MRNTIILWVAKGLGIGAIPVAPGTFGSVLGFGWLALLLMPGTWWTFGLGTAAGLAASVWFCGRAEALIGKTDPGPVVLDEIAAIPVCCIAWIILEFGRIPRPAECFVEKWPWLVAIFVLFRIFDVAKPWPVHQSQSLPGGWGITCDDALAAVYVNIVVLLFWFGRGFLMK